MQLFTFEMCPLTYEHCVCFPLERTCNLLYLLAYREEMDALCKGLKLSFPVLKGSHQANADVPSGH